MAKSQEDQPEAAKGKPTEAKAESDHPFRGERDRPVTIRAEGITKHYGDFAALQDVSFEVRKGTVAAFLGPNGAGKSTTMKILTGYLAPTAGRAQVLGLDPLDEQQRTQLARRLGYLPESGPLYRDMTPLESLQFYGELRNLPGLDAAIDRVVSLCSIAEVRHKPIEKLSKGYRQRVGMAQALLHDPEVLILDEPASGLDPLQIRELRKLIRELGREKTILLSTHILQEVEAVADEVIVISDGRVAFSGTKEELAKGDKSLEERFYEFTGNKEEVA